MSVIFRNIQVPLFIKIENNILGNIRNVFQSEHLHFTRPMILSSQTVMQAGGNEIMQGFSEEAIKIIDNSTIEYAQYLADEIRAKNNDLVIAIGGGRVLDVGKYAATKAQVNYISIPTTPSHDGIASPIAVLKDDQGLKQSLGVNMPMGIIVDLDIIKKAPIINFQAGTGDLLSNFSALSDWHLANQDKGEKIDDFAASLAYSAADLLYGNITQKEKINLTSDKFLKTLINGLIISGIAMNIAGSSRPCSGAEHKISHAIDKLYPNSALHGQQVAYGILIAEKIRNNDYKLYQEFYRNIGLPTTFKDIKLTEEQIIQAILFAPKTRPDRYTILDKLQLNESQIKKIIHDL